VFTARYALSPYIKQIRFVFKGLNKGTEAVFSNQYYMQCCLKYSLMYDVSELAVSDRITTAVVPSRKMSCALKLRVQRTTSSPQVIWA
jgi:hypothetical protein